MVALLNEAELRHAPQLHRTIETLRDNQIQSSGELEYPMVTRHKFVNSRHASMTMAHQLNESSLECFLQWIGTSTSNPNACAIHFRLSASRRYHVLPPCPSSLGLSSRVHPNRSATTPSRISLSQLELRREMHDTNHSLAFSELCLRVDGLRRKFTCPFVTTLMSATTIRTRFSVLPNSSTSFTHALLEPTE